MFLSVVFQLALLRRKESTLGPNFPFFFISAHPSHLLKSKYSITFPTDKRSGCTFRSPLSPPGPPIFAGDNKNLIDHMTKANLYLLPTCLGITILLDNVLSLILTTRTASLCSKCIAIQLFVIMKRSPKHFKSF